MCEMYEKRQIVLAAKWPSGEISSGEMCSSEMSCGETNGGEMSRPHEIWVKNEIMDAVSDSLGGGAGELPST